MFKKTWDGELLISLDSQNLKGQKKKKKDDDSEYSNLERKSQI